MEKRTFWVGVDTGGTFTDAVAIENGEKLHLAKTPSTPQDLSAGVMNAMALLAASAGLPLQAFLSCTQKVAHGTTATVNAMVQRRGAKTGLITTKGFKDHFIIMKSGRGVGVPDVEKVRFSRAVKPVTLVPPALTEEVNERIDYAGRVLVPLDEEDARQAIQNLLDQGVEAIAISLLWSFRNPAHETRIRDLVREMAPHVIVSAGSELVPVMGEYERTATSIINVYLGPVLSSYVHALQEKLEANGFRFPMLLMQSDGGLIPGNAAPDKAVTTMLSGLAAGVLGARQIAESLDCRNIITIDMGGTSFEVGLVHEGQPVIENFPLTTRLAPYESRWRIAYPTIDITAIGAGGGSIARVDGGVIKVGPISAGADPGPACYNQGGTEPTVTDAFLVLGYINPDNFLGGRMRVEKERSIRAIKEKIADPLGIDVIDAANGIYRVVINHMADLIRKVTIERGHDPRDFVMIAFGGCGPIHCGVLGAELGVPKAVVPGSGLATALSAYGLMASDMKSSIALSRQLSEPIDIADVRRHVLQVSEKATANVKTWGVKDTDISCLCSIDMRFKGQIHGISVPVPSDLNNTGDLEMIYGRFEENYERLYGEGTAHRDAGIEMVTFRAEAIGVMAKPRITGSSGSTVTKKVEPAFRRKVFFDAEEFPEVAVFDGDRLLADTRIEGPAVVEYMGNTVVVHPGQVIYIDPHFNLIFDLRGPDV